MALLTSFETSKRPSSAPNAGFFQRLQTVALLRMGTGLLLLLYFGIPAAVNGYQFVWNAGTWEWVKIVASAKFPAPHLLTPIAGGITILVSLSWLVGFYSRLFAILFLPVVFGGIALAEGLNAQAYEPFCYLLLFVTLTVILYGSGMISVDAVFQFAEQPKKKKRGMFDD